MAQGVLLQAQDVESARRKTAQGGTAVHTETDHDRVMEPGFGARRTGCGGVRGRRRCGSAALRGGAVTVGDLVHRLDQGVHVGVVVVDVHRGPYHLGQAPGVHVPAAVRRRYGDQMDPAAGEFALYVGGVETVDHEGDDGAARGRAGR